MRVKENEKTTHTILFTNKIKLIYSILSVSFVALRAHTHTQDIFTEKSQSKAEKEIEMRMKTRNTPK